MTEYQELRRSNKILDDPDALHARLGEDGYLFIKKLHDPVKLLELRRQMLTAMQVGGWIKEGTDPLDGFAEPGVQCTEGDIGYTEVYHEMYKLQLFHESAHWPEVLSVMERIRGRPTIPQPEKVARLWFPNYTEHTTPVHQDFVHFQGSIFNLTCWTPVGDCPRELGGLAVLKGSHKVNRVLDHHFSLGAGSLMVDPAKHGLYQDWRTTDYEIGDSLIFPALTIHKALPNESEDRLRISLDNRYQAIEDPMAEHMTLPHLHDFDNLSWDQIYETWTNEELQYYWKDLGIKIVPRDLSYNEVGFQEACQKAIIGDPDARYFLKRFIKRDPKSENAKCAAKILAGADRPIGKLASR
jgi:hypothetical protein